MTKSFRTISASFAIFLLIGSPLYAFDIPKTKSDYSADYVAKDFAHVRKGKIFYSGGQIRMETDYEGDHLVLIAEPKYQNFYVLLPTRKLYERISKDEAQGVFGYLAANNNLKHTYAGEDEVNGEMVKMLVYPEDCDDCTIEGFTWYTKDGIMVRMEEIVTAIGANSKVSIELKNIKRAKLKTSLFEIPDEYETYDEEPQYGHNPELDIME